MRRTNPFRQQPIISDAQYENTLVESQVEILRSEGLARLVVARQELVKDETFNSIGAGLLGSVMMVVGKLLGSSSEEVGGNSAAVEHTRAAEKLTRLVGVRRIGVTSLIEVSVRTPNRHLSARLANGVAEAYLQNQLASVADISAQASGWLEDRIQQLRDQAITADREVQAYKANHNILDTDRGRFNEQQLGEVSTQLSTARARLAEAQAKFERVQALTVERLADASVPEAMENSVIVGLRRQYLDARRRESEWSSRYGSSHAAAVNARIEMTELQRSIQNELNRILESYRSELAVAKANEEQISRQLAELATVSASTDADRIMLRALQSSADTYKAIYENFLQRYTQAVQDQSFPIPEARIITSAVPPLRKSQPKVILLLAVGIVLGIAYGIVLALLRELMDQGLRTPAQVKAATGFECVGLLPRLPRSAYRSGHGAEAEPALRQLSAHPSALRHVADQPGSTYAEAMRDIVLRTAWQRGARGAQVIGCVAPAQGDGTTTTAANLAYAFAEAGYRTVLVDLDLRTGQLTAALAPKNAGGAAEVAEGAISADKLVWHDVQSGLHFLPAAVGHSAARPARVLAPARVEHLLKELRASYERVVIDLPAFGITADASAIAEQLDGILLVLDWGDVSAEALDTMLDRLGGGRERLLGVALNRVDLRRLSHYGVP